MATLVEVSHILEAARREPPLSLAEVGRRMAAKRVRHETVRACVDFLERLGFVSRGSKGVQWTLVRDEKLWKAVARGKPLGSPR
jgi:DNA-binding IclR family transcriptional regulator